MAYGCQLDYNVSQTGCHVEAIYRSSCTGNFIIEKYGLQISTYVEYLKDFSLHPRLVS